MRRACSSWIAVGFASSIALAAASLPSQAQTADPDPWARHAQWVSLRAGYAKSNVEGSGDGNIGAGFGYQRFWSSKLALGAFVHFELLGRYGAAAEFENPWTVEVTRHFRWTPAARPYFGLGGGAFLHKFYRTGADLTTIRPGFYLVGGTNMAVSDRSLLGVDARMIFQGDAQSDDPVFPNDQDNAVHWSVKLNWSRLF
jgi:hypothetical protein